MWTFLACLAVGVAAMSGVDGLSEAFRAGVASRASTILGGDVEISRSGVTASAAEAAAFAGLGRVSAVEELRVMALTGRQGGKRALASLKAVDKAYPLTGSVALAPSMALEQALGQRDGRFGAAAHPDLLARLGARVGESILVGDAWFEVRAVIADEPDRAFRLLAFGPRVIVSQEGLTATGLVQPGSMIRYAYRVALDPAVSPEAAARQVGETFPLGGWRVVSSGEAAPSLRENFQRLGGVMALVGLAALILGGLGVSAAVDAYLEAKTRSIAVYRAVGATPLAVFWVFFPLVLSLCVAGILLGLGVGAGLGLLAAPALSDVLPVAPKAGLYPKSLALAGAFGLLVSLCFCLPPLSARSRVSPQVLFRGYASQTRARPGPVAVAASAACGLAAAGLVLATTPDPRLGWGFLGSMAVCAVTLRLAAWLVVRLARLLPRPRDFRAAMALAALARPGNQTGQVVVCLGLGLTAMAGITLADANFSRALRQDLPEAAPAFFFLNVQDTRLEAFVSLLRSIPGVVRVETAPSLRGRIMKVKGVPAEELDLPQSVAWAVRGERSLTLSGPMPAGTNITAGQWWPENYSGPPLASLDAEVAKGLGLGVGDTLTLVTPGREMEVTVASLRRINWLSLALNHVFILSPGSLDGLPMSSLATAYVDPAHPDAFAQVYDQVTAAFPGVNVQRVDEALRDVAQVAGQIGLAVRASAGVTLAAGLLVLAQSLRAQLARRFGEAVVFKVCGARRFDILAILLGEYALAGLAAGLAALVLGGALSWFFITMYLSIPWRFAALPALATLAGGAGLTLMLALRGVWRMLGEKAWPYLRNE